MSTSGAAPAVPDLFDRTTSADSPAPLYAALRRRGVVHDARRDVWLVSRYEDCTTVLRSPEVFRQWDASELQADAPASGDDRPSTLANADPPAHTRHRTLVAQAWSPRRTADGMAERIEAVATELVDAFPAGPVEMVGAFAHPLPVIVIAEILGVPVSMREEFKRWSDDLVAPLAGPLDDERRRECAESARSFRRYFTAEIRDRRAAPRDDVLTALLTAGDADLRPLDEAEAISVLIQLLVAGHETTTKLIASLAHRLATEHGLAPALRDDPSLVAPTVEETLRIDAPVQALFRRTARATTLAGQAIPAGAKVLVLFGSANRDTPPFAEPDRFDPSREGVRRHLGFGHGVHVCLGAPLARREAQIALRLMVERLPGLRPLAGRPVVHLRNPLLRGPHELWLEHDG